MVQSVTVRGHFTIFPLSSGRHADAIFTNSYRKVLGQISARKFLQTIMGKRLGENRGTEGSGVVFTDPGRQLGMATLQSKLKSIKVPDMSGKARVSHIGKVEYSITGVQITNIGLPTSTVGLVPGTGVSLSIGNAYISLRGRWKVKFHRFLKLSGSFDLAVSGLTITTQIKLQSDKTGRPVVSSVNCVARVGTVKIKFHGGASWLYNLFRSFIEKAFRKALEKQICPRVDEAVSDMNPRLRTLNVLAKVDKFAEIEYSMVGSPVVAKQSIDFGLKGQFYNIGKHQEPPFAAPPFALPAQNTNMLYMGLSSFTANSAGFVYNNAGVLSIYITDDMIPKKSPIRLTTKTFGALIPEIAERFPNLPMKILVKTVKAPKITFEPDKMTLQTMGSVTAYVIQTNGTLYPLFVLNVDTSVSGHPYITGAKLAGTVSLNKLSITLGKSNVGPFQVKWLDNILLLVLKLAVIPQVNALDKMNLVNAQLRVLKDYMLIGTDVRFTP
ncbi:hypothetical protein SKAU_G00178090 [Synaphobranchus kaupii]|uniref:Bactericidal permeability-increasing protein n=1 Tax=Synaphobranchus kaupii TaxID=118154 RepID=A0A9Q1FMD3_SYNKA|nr:hypothetical protein SKAU_G00178090 [Synaphobranchus kaupii]